MIKKGVIVMARPLRVEYERACYHVISRGNHSEVVFKDGSDCELFLEKLVEFSELYEVVIHSYCLMPNHFHLQIRTLHANLSKFMQSFLTSFTINMNRKYFKSGHLFQGRYKAQLVDNALYKNKLSRYIHLNPVKIKSHEGVALSTIKSRLKDYKWSSYRFYIGLDKKPTWLDRRFVLSSWGGSAAEKIHNYQEYVEQGIKRDNTDDIRGSVGGSIIGSEPFKEKIVNKYLNQDVTDIDSREQPVLAKVNAFTIEDVFETVCDYYGLKNLERIRRRKGTHSEARKMAMFLLGRHCRRNETLTSLAKRFGVRISGFNMATVRFSDELRKNSNIRENLDRIEQVLKNKSNNVEV